MESHSINIIAGNVPLNSGNNNWCSTVKSAWESLLHMLDLAKFCYFIKYPLVGHLLPAASVLFSYHPILVFSKGVFEIVI